MKTTCKTCGSEYEVGAPHQAFCPGCKPDERCSKCGKRGSAKSGGREVFACRECYEVFCDSCGNSCDRVCDGCGGC